jgi:hypothetical protein
MSRAKAICYIKEKRAAVKDGRARSMYPAATLGHALVISCVLEIFEGDFKETYTYAKYGVLAFLR